MTEARVPVKIVLAPFPGSCEAHYMGEMLPRCDLYGCQAQVLFRDEEHGTLVCYLHGQLELRRQWGVQERSDVEIWGEVL